jgi:hypothetical protein
MQHSSSERPLRSHFFVLHLWEVRSSQMGGPSLWRLSVEDGQSGERKGFKNLATFVAFLEAWMQNPATEG